MYEDLVAEYLSYPLPSLIERPRYQLELPDPKRRNLIYPLVGVRRSGKTFCLFQMMQRLMEQGSPRDKMLFFPFDDERLDHDQQNLGDRVLDAYFKLVPEAQDGCYLFFDEIQEMPGWDAFIRRISEQYPVTLVITGSSSKLLSTDIPTKLRGRSLATEIWPLSFKEYCSFHSVDCGRRRDAFTSKQRRGLETAFGGYLEIGGFPAVQELEKVDRARILQSYADEIVTKDVLERFETVSFRIGRRFARTALRSTGLRFSVNRQIKDLRSMGLSINDAAAYALLDDFEDAHLMFKCVDYSRSIRDNPKRSSKLYAVDQGLSLAVAPASHMDLGQRLETAVYIELKRRFGMNRDNVISSYSSPACPEVDFVIGDLLLEAEYGLVQVAVEGVERKSASEVGNLRIAMRETGLDRGTIVTLDEEGTIEAEEGTVDIVPAWKWFLGE